MSLNDRKMRILEAVIKDYIALAEPIGSRTISKKYDFGLSSATIRNEMSDLEEMGYIMAPHASSGRIPTDKGYRLYVDEGLMRKRRLSGEEKALLAGVLQGRAESLVEEMARVVSEITNYTTVATQPHAPRHKIKHIHMFAVDGPVVALVVVTDLNIVKNQVAVLPGALTNSTISKISAMLTSIFADATAQEINGLYRSVLEQRFREVRYCQSLVEPLVAAIQAALLSAEGTNQIYTIGIKNILEFPEFADIQKARAILATLEEKEGLMGLLATCGLAADINIIIGAENENTTLKECSVIKAKISVNGQFCGSMAIIGPTRMDYAQVMSVLQMMLS